MTLLRMDNVGIIVEDLDAMIAFFTELGLRLEGRGPVEGAWAEKLIAIDGMRVEMAMLRTPDGHSAIELSRFIAPAVIRPEPQNAPVNTLGIRRLMFAVDDLDRVVERLLARGAELVGEVTQYENAYRPAYLRGPEGLLVALAEAVG